MQIKYKLIDVSSHNGDIDFKKVKSAGIDGVIIRGGYGSNTTDKNFHKNIKNAIANNLHIGVYWFGYAYTDAIAVTEAKYCLSVIEKYKGQIDLPIFYDWEYDSYNYAKKTGGVTPTKAKVSSWVESFCSTVEKSNYFVGVYGNVDYLTNYFDSNLKSKYTIWVAQWASSCTYSGSYGIWQYGAETNKIDSKTVDGISGVVDKNYCYIDYPSIIVSKGLNGYTASSTLTGDLNGDGKVDSQDVEILKKAILGAGTTTDTSTMDLNGDGKVDSLDLLQLKKAIS
jgi:GH25 family lysozyme M1 (1,4-beta-N-acetylmuramidase)